jgi:ParB-like chromosome segregation protein Spo0J
MTRRQVGRNTFVIPVDSVSCGSSPRLSGEDADHVRALAESATIPPPIVVHRPTMRVIDGAHRLRAAQLRGQRHIEVQYFDGTEDEAFVFSVRANLSHGLPLTLADRLAAARRIITVHPDWSDRRVGAIAGLAGTTVASLRKQVPRSTAAQSSARVGADGRVRPLDSGERRRRASELIKERPDASIREIARTVGIAPSTALDVRDRVRKGMDPVPRQARARAKDKLVTPAVDLDRDALLAILRRDPSLRFTESGRMLLRWLDVNTAAAEEWGRHLHSVPEHCTKLVADLSRLVGQSWLCFADQLESEHRIAQ